MDFDLFTPHLQWDKIALDWQEQCMGWLILTGSLDVIEGQIRHYWGEEGATCLFTCLSIHMGAYVGELSIFYFLFYSKQIMQKGGVECFLLLALLLWYSVAWSTLFISCFWYLNCAEELGKWHQAFQKPQWCLGSFKILRPLILNLSSHILLKVWVW